MISPSPKQFAKLAENANLIPVYKELLADLLTPVAAYLKISAGRDYAYLLESVEGGERIGRYTFVGADPSIVIETSGRNGVRIKNGSRENFTIEDGSDPLDEIKKMMANYKAAEVSSLPPFFGGAVGYIGYDSVRFFEKLPEISIGDTDMPEVGMMLADSLLIFDNVKQSLKIVACVHIKNGEDLETAYAKAVSKIEAMENRLETNLPEVAKQTGGYDGKVEYSSNTGKEKFKQSVERCKEYIKAGDIFQVVLAQRLTIPLHATGFEVYRALRAINPSPYMYYLKMGEWEVVGASPEILSRSQGGIVTVRPIAGTRPRGTTEEEDNRLEAELMSDAKELAEHIMLVDLGRNDVGRVSKGGGVKVTDLKIVERYSHVMHIVSQVEGQLADGKDAYDVIRATFPAGTLSGAPKIRAMEIIEELEPNRRSLYGGAVGWFSFNGDMDTAIAIRTLAVKGSVAYLGIGAGIVADSDPEKEWEETHNKGKALIKAIELANSLFASSSGKQA